MLKRFVAIWFRNLCADYEVRRQPSLRQAAFVLVRPYRGRQIIAYVSESARSLGISPNMVVADARALVPELSVMPCPDDAERRLLGGLALWCGQFTPDVAVDMPDGLLLDVTGCAHLWGDDQGYLQDIQNRLSQMGYRVRLAMAGTVGAAWALARYGLDQSIIANGEERAALALLPPAALRIETPIALRLQQLGLTRLGQLFEMPRYALRRRFGVTLLQRIDQALGWQAEPLTPVKAVARYIAQLPALEPICTATGIEIALRQLLQMLCNQLAQAERGVRTATLSCYRIDGQVQEVNMGTIRPTRNPNHLFYLLSLQIPSIEPDLGIERFSLEAVVTEPMTPEQEAIWERAYLLAEAKTAELIDRIMNRLGSDSVYRWLPVASHWPERSFKRVKRLDEEPEMAWREYPPRPIRLLSKPEPIGVTVPMPDYPPVTFVQKGRIHYISCADGPERIEAEWWRRSGAPRDYYIVEDKEGVRFWIFREGLYSDTEPLWFLHGYFG